MAEPIFRNTTRILSSRDRILNLLQDEIRRNVVTTFPGRGTVVGNFGEFVLDPRNPQTPPQEPAPETSAEIDTKLQILISSIPIANSGQLITSEYHNSLREAVRGLASRIGLSVSPTEETKVLTFAPDFLPITPKEGSNLKWDVTLNRAALPDNGLNGSQLVSGGFVVQLPQSSTIAGMRVRGTRSGAGGANPREFTVALNRVKFGNDLNEPSTLISIDLKAVPDGAFNKDGEVTLTESETNTTNEALVGFTKAVKQLVNNSDWMYFVTANFRGAQGTPRFEIHSIQISCLA